MITTIRRLTLCALLFAATPAWAYHFYDDPSGSDPPRWRSNAVGMSINTISFPATGSLHGPINDTIELWDDDEIPGSALGVTAGSINSLFISNNDNVNMVVATDLGTCEPGNIGFTDPRIPIQFLAWGGDFEEADILFNSNCTFTTAQYFDMYDALRAANQWDIRQLTIHEMGHSVGLEHENGTYDLGSSIGAGGVCCFPEIYDYAGFPTVMETWTSGGAFVADTGYLSRKYGVNEDDREGLRVLYPTGPSPILSDHDLAVSSYYTPDEDTITLGFKGTDCHNAVGARSRPDPRVDLFDLAMSQGLAFGSCPTGFDSVPPPEYTPPPATPLEVLSGATLSVVFSLLNLGTISETDVPFRVVMTQTIGATCPSSTCFVVEDASPDVSPNTPYERTTTFTVPDAPDGEYYLVAQIDYSGSITERDENNNIAVWNQKLEIVSLGCGCSTITGSSARLGSLWSLGVLALLGALRLGRRGRTRRS